MMRILFPLIFVIGTAPVWGASAENPNLSLKAEIIGPHAIKPLMAVEIKLTLTNVSSVPEQVIKLVSNDSDLKCMFKHENIEIHVNRPHTISNHEGFQILYPGDSDDISLLLAYDWDQEIFYFTEPGLYTFQAKVFSSQRDIPPDGTRTFASSNILEITVLPPTEEENVQLEELKAINAWQYAYAILHSPYEPSERKRIAEEAVRFYNRYPSSIYSADLLPYASEYYYDPLIWQPGIEKQQADEFFKQDWQVMMYYIQHPHASTKEGAIKSMHDSKQKYLDRFGALPEGLPEIPE